MTQISPNHQTLQTRQSQRKRKPKVGWGQETAGGGKIWKYDQAMDAWLLMSPEQTHYRDPTTNRWTKLAPELRTYKFAGVELHRNKAVWHQGYQAPYGMFPMIRFAKRETIIEGRMAEIRMDLQHQWAYWRHAPDKIIVGDGNMTFMHYVNGAVKQIGFDSRARKRTINKEKWLEKRRLRAKAEKSLKVIQKLGSVAPDELPPGWRFDLKKGAECYGRLLESLAPDCPSVSIPDMQYFGECVLWQAKQSLTYWNKTLTQEKIDKAFVTMRAKLRTEGYRTDNVYEYEDYLDHPFAVNV